MTKHLVLLAALGLALGLTTNVDQAYGKASGLKGDGVYGTAGCGLGSLVFGNEEGGMQIIAATLNGTFASQTFGITTGTSNCGAGLFAKAEVDSFIKSNEVALENDIARGEGETLSTLNNMLGCKADFGATLQNNYKAIYGEGANASETIQALAQSCEG